MNDVQEWDDVEIDGLRLDGPVGETLPDLFVDALDKPPCPRCTGSLWDLDAELHAWVCDDCGLWLDAEDDPDDAT